MKIVERKKKENNEIWIFRKTDKVKKKKKKKKEK